jgi:hypothetical protein
VKGARGGSEEEQRIVQHVALPSRLGGRLEFGGEAAEFLVKETAVGSEILPAPRLLGLVGELMGEIVDRKFNCSDLIRKG